MACVETYPVDLCSHGYSVAAVTDETLQRLRLRESAGHRMASGNTALEAEHHWDRNRMMNSSWAGAFRDYRPDDSWERLGRIGRDAVVSSPPVAGTRICTSVAESPADSLGAVCFVTSALHLGSSNTPHAMPLTRLLWSNSGLPRKDATVVHSRSHCLCEKDRCAGRSLAHKVIPAWPVEQSFVGWPTTGCRSQACLAVSVPEACKHTACPDHDGTCASRHRKAVSVVRVSELPPERDVALCMCMLAPGEPLGARSCCVAQALCRQPCR